MPAQLISGHCLDVLSEVPELDLIATDPPYAFGGASDEHALSATVAIALREYAMKLRCGRWMLVMCASSWRSTAYMVERVRALPVLVVLTYAIPSGGHRAQPPSTTSYPNRSRYTCVGTSPIST